MSAVDIVMYHYVRDLKNSRYPDIKGLDVELFRKQIEYILKKYTVITMEDLIEACGHNTNLPDNSMLLTFDDGYKDHFDFVFPILDEYGVQGSFFPPAKAIQENKVLDVNKIHFVLASVDDKREIIDNIITTVGEQRTNYSLKSDDYYWRKYAIKSRFDTKEVMFIKNMLQRELPSRLRDIIIDSLFYKYVSSDESSFSKELYMSVDQLKLMKRKGMYIGSHGYNHQWLNTLPENEQENEIILSLKFLKTLGCSTKDFAFCYPYGAHDNSLRSILKKNGCAVAFTTLVETANIKKNDKLTLPRIDTNDVLKIMKDA